MNKFYAFGMLLSCLVNISQQLPPACSLPPKSGPCEALFYAYYYNARADECLEFIYGGCGGNENRFNSKSECETTCKN